MSLCSMLLYLALKGAFINLSILKDAYDLGNRYYEPRQAYKEWFRQKVALKDPPIYAPMNPLLSNELENVENTLKHKIEEHKDMLEALKIGRKKQKREVQEEKFTRAERENEWLKGEVKKSKDKYNESQEKLKKQAKVAKIWENRANNFEEDQQQIAKSIGRLMPNLVASLEAAEEKALPFDTPREIEHFLGLGKYFVSQWKKVGHS
ncbi:uncharacterized protein G2W53_035236 [Senna tora]|uniref:Uncharacterized protein n=1 Tax=Senna tora TaxID=362788 RepID=A0A834SPR7_9FABA|nr:uncharacterized protein G2W53_035236 [Senna tora]